MSSEVAARRSRSQEDGQEEAATQARPAVAAAASAGPGRAQAHTDQCLRPGSWIYEPEKIVGERQKNMGGGKYETQWEVKWKDWDKKHNTYEPIKNLAGCEDMIVEYRERKRQRESELEHSLDSGARALAVCSIQRRVMVTRWQRWRGG